MTCAPVPTTLYCLHLDYDFYAARLIFPFKVIFSEENHYLRV